MCAALPSNLHKRVVGFLKPCALLLLNSLAKLGILFEHHALRRRLRALLDLLSLILLDGGLDFLQLRRLGLDLRERRVRSRADR